MTFYTNVCQSFMIRRECAMSVLGTAKHSLCNYIGTWQQGCILSITSKIQRDWKGGTVIIHNVLHVPCVSASALQCFLPSLVD